MIELQGTGNLDRNEVGGKALHLDHLISLKLRVPPTVVLPINEERIDIASIVGWLMEVVGANRCWRIAIRSSSACEDTDAESKAGHYLSLLGEYDSESLVPAIQCVRASGPQVAVIIQPLLDAAWAGVLFSCDPLTYARDEATVAWTEGLADKLVSGDEPGHRIRLQKSGNLLIGEWPARRLLFDQLIQGTGLIEESLKVPIDVEWVVDRNQILWFVQARPIVRPQSCRVHLDSQSVFTKLPVVVRQHPKIRLRRQAMERGVMMAPAIVECQSDFSEDAPDSAIVTFEKSAGVSVVLLHPERIDREIVREFAPVRGSDVDSFARTCRRYAIRRYPRTADITVARSAVLEAGMQRSWVSVAIMQAIYDAYATGIVQKSKDGYIIEVALGHFVPKGVVPTSSIILSHDKRIISATWREQPTAYRFIDGHVVTETPPKQNLHLDEHTLIEIAKTFDPLFDTYEAPVFEFGILKGQNRHAIYLIDLAEGDSSSSILDHELITSGVLSGGSCRGRLYHVKLSAAGALDSHLHDQLQAASVEGQNVIIVAERASVDLLPFVGAPGVVGFIFEWGSVLAHLAVVLREKGIPAVVLEDAVTFGALPVDALVEIDASQRSLKHKERVKLVRGLNGIDNSTVYKPGS
jgi:phosphohistidine swiveling domain-containing protein